MEEDIEHKIDILNIVQERDFNKETCEDSYIEAVLLGIETVLNELERLQEENELLIENAIHNDKVVDRCRFENGRLQKENEKLKLINQSLENTKDTCPNMATSGIRCNLKNSIPKQVIRDEIEKRKQHCSVINSFVIEALEDLLGE